MKPAYLMLAILLLAAVALSQDLPTRAAFESTGVGLGDRDPSPVHLTLSVPRLVLPASRFDQESWHLQKAREDGGDISQAERINEKIMRAWQERWQREIRSGLVDETRVEGACGLLPLRPIGA